VLAAAAGKQETAGVLMDALPDGPALVQQLAAAAAAALRAGHAAVFAAVMRAMGLRCAGGVPLLLQQLGMPLPLSAGVSAVVGGWAKQTSELHQEKEALRQREHVLEGEMQAAQLLLVSSALNMRQAQQLAAEASTPQQRQQERQAPQQQGKQLRQRTLQQQPQQQQQQQQQITSAGGPAAEDSALYYACVQPFQLVACGCLLLLTVGTLLMLHCATSH
jgi:hypothetical protein